MTWRNTNAVYSIVNLVVYEIKRNNMASLYIDDSGLGDLLVNGHREHLYITLVKRPRFGCDCVARILCN